MDPTADAGVAKLARLERGSHACWIVDDTTDYVEVAKTILADGERQGEKLFAFGPHNGRALELLEPFVAVAVDPRIAFLDGGPLDPEAMFAMFRAQAAQARDEGFTGLRLVADMDWLLPADTSTDDVVAFEVCLDGVVSELGATVVCAYRRRSFDVDAIVGTLCVHPVGVGDDAPPFRLVAGEENMWALSGEIDLGTARTFATAMAAVAGDDGCVVDARDLSFIDVGGMRAIAVASVDSKRRIVVRRAPPVLRRCWELGEFAAMAPLVDLTP